MGKFDPGNGSPLFSETVLRSLLAVDVDVHFEMFTKAYHNEVRNIVRQVLNARRPEETSNADSLASVVFLQMYGYLKNLKPDELLKQHLWTKLYQFTVERCFSELLAAYQTHMYNAVQGLLNKDKLEQGRAVMALAEEIFTCARQQLGHCDQQAIQAPLFWLWLYNSIISHCFEHLLETYRPQLEAFVLRLSSNSDEAEDIVQQALLNAFKHLKAHGVPSRGTFDPRAWIFTIAKRAFLKSLRRRNPFGQNLSIDNVSEEHPVFEIEDDYNVSPEAILEISEAQRYLAELVSQLAEPYRTVMRLRFHDDLTNEEIAAQLDMKPVTVRSYIHRGLKRLRQHIKPL
ncbi:MAG TPA: RNA polymerase sigma factor [Ktedonobacteraceae bacterium]|nr:RNA polymerase sigma factor [Ktedonobacteraceae bacterium]